MGGIVAGAVVGGPVGTYLVRRHNLHAAKRRHSPAMPVEMQDVVEDHLPHANSDAPAGEDGQTYTLLKNLVAVLTAMWAGFWISKGFAAIGATLPAYIGAMLAAALLRNLDDVTGWFGLSQKIIDEIGSIALSLFLVMALMTLKLWDLAGLAAPLFVILLAQVLLVARADSPTAPIKGTPDLAADIVETKALIGSKSLLVMERTCIDPVNYGLKGKGIDIRPYTKSTNLNEMVPALLNADADFTLLDVPDAILDLQRWAGKIKVIGPISGHQELAAAFPKTSPELRRAFDEYLVRVKADGTYDKLVDKYYPGIRRYFPAFFAGKG